MPGAAPKQQALWPGWPLSPSPPPPHVGKGTASPNIKYRNPHPFPFTSAPPLPHSCFRGQGRFPQSTQLSGYKLYLGEYFLKTVLLLQFGICCHTELVSLVISILPPTVSFFSPSQPPTLNPELFSLFPWVTGEVTSLLPRLEVHMSFRS